jgi:glycosyltransferase A (GT-A) superfamily protein (DUF2064 family)
VLALLVDAPDSGVVLTELAAEVGAASARRLYRVLLARAIAAARGAELGWTVWYRPTDALPVLRRWLGDEADLRPQASGSIGARSGGGGGDQPARWLDGPAPANHRA